MPTSEKSKDTLHIFVLADTHNRLPETVSEIAKDADEIWHLGDVCTETILDQLRAVGPRVTVVRGNCDSNFDWPLVVDLARGGLKFRLQHIPPDHLPRLGVRPGSVASRNPDLETARSRVFRFAERACVRGERHQRHSAGGQAEYVAVETSIRPARGPELTATPNYCRNFLAQR